MVAITQMTKTSVMLLALSAFSAAAGQLLFKVGAQGRVRWIEFISVPIVGGVLLYGISMVLWIFVLSFEKLVNVYAFTALTFVLVYIGGVVIIGERISMPGAFGVGLVLCGLYLITNYSS